MTTRISYVEGITKWRGKQWLANGKWELAAYLGVGKSYNKRGGSFGRHNLL
jgi:hypothetical protein